MNKIEKEDQLNNKISEINVDSSKIIDLDFN